MALKKTEKIAIGSVLMAMAGMIAFGVYYELFLHKGASGNLAVGTPAGPEAQRLNIRSIPPGINPAALPEPDSRGATLLTLYCVQCHDLPVPSMHGREGWTVVLRRMENLMREHRGGTLSRVMMPGEKDWGMLRAYLAEHALPVVEAAQLPDAETAEGQAFTQTCSRCHALPDPQQHIRDEWPRVVVRMRANMESAGQAPPSPQQLDAIIAYLQGHSPVP